MSADMDTEQHRAVGLEMEYEPQYTLLDSGGNSLHTEPYHTQKILGMVHDHYYATDNGHLGNGYRFYYDSGMSEGATPECYPDTVGVMQLHAEDIVLQAMLKLEPEILARHQKPGSPLRVLHLLPLSVSDLVSTRGFHENYEAFLDPNLHVTERNRLTRQLEYFSATAVVWTGQGVLDTRTASALEVLPALFLPSQKVGKLNMKGTNGRVDTKQNPIEYGYRFEFRRNDYPITHWQLRHRMSYTSAVIRTLEKGETLLDIDGFNEVEPEAVAEMANGGLSNKFSYNGKMISALDLQIMILEKVTNAAIRFGYPDYEVEACEELARVLDALKHDPLAARDAVSWVLKQAVLQDKYPNILSGTGAYTNELRARAKRLCILMDSLGAEGLLSRFRALHSLYTQDEIDEAAIGKFSCTPTAQKRAKTIREYGEDARKYKALWMTDTLYPGDAGRVRRALLPQGNDHSP